MEPITYIDFRSVTLIDPPILPLGEETLSIYADGESIFIRVGTDDAPGSVVAVPWGLKECLWRTLGQMEG